MLQAQRQSGILDYLTSEGFASVAELGQHFQVSEMTIRRDLAELEQRGLLQRKYGGAVAGEAVFFEMAFQAKNALFIAEKQRIGLAAASLVKPGQTVLLDSGSTTGQVAACLRDMHLTVVTTGLNIASDLLAADGIELHLAGGMLRKATLSLVGPQTDDFLKTIRADWLFLGVDGVDVFSGFTVPDIINARTKRAMVAAARKTVVVTDHSKLGRNTTSHIVPLEGASLLITGHEADPELVQTLRQHVEMMLV
jgi:DeoR family transcriptional regulator, fructose operon transcriptional repressor